MSEKSKLLWRCRRGVKELDVLFTQFVEQSYDSLSDNEKSAFDKLLKIEDPDILAFILYSEIPSDPDVARIIEKIHSRI
jgi:antitoxin CptB